MKDYDNFEKITEQIASILVENEATVSDMHLIANRVNERLRVVDAEVRNDKSNYSFGMRIHDST